MTRPLVSKTIQRPRSAAAFLVFALSGAASLAFVIIDGGFAPRAWPLVAGVIFGVALQRGELSLVRAWRDLLILKDAGQLFGFLFALGTAGILTLGALALLDSKPPATARIGPVSWLLPIAAFIFGVGSVIARGGVMVHMRRLGEGSLIATPALAAIFLGFVGGIVTWPWTYANAIAQAPRLWLPATFGYSGTILLQTAMLAVLAAPLWRFRPRSPSPGHGLKRQILVDPWPAPWAGTLLGLLVAVSYAAGEPLGLIAECATVARSLATALGLAPANIPELDTGVGGLAAPLLQGLAITQPVVIALGFLAGAFACALGSGRFSFGSFTLREGCEMVVGGLLIGWGAMTALGAITGEAIAGVAVGAVSGWIFMACASLGVVTALRFDRREDVVPKDPEAAKSET